MLHRWRRSVARLARWRVPLALAMAACDREPRTRDALPVTFTIDGVACRAHVESNAGERDVQTPWRSEPIAVDVHDSAHLRVWIDPNCAPDPSRIVCGASIEGMRLESNHGVHEWGSIHRAANVQFCEVYRSLL